MKPTTKILLYGIIIGYFISNFIFDYYYGLIDHMIFDLALISFWSFLSYRVLKKVNK